MLKTSSSLTFAVPVPHRLPGQSIHPTVWHSWIGSPPSSSAWSLSTFIIRETIAGIGKKADAAAVVCHCLVSERLETAYMNCLHVYTDGSIDRLRAAATVTCHILAYGVNLAGHLSYCTSSTTAELCATRLALEVLLHHSAPSSAVVLTDSRAALIRLQKAKKASMFSRQMIHNCRTLENDGWTSYLQWIPSHAGLKGNDVADNLAKVSHRDYRGIGE